MSVYGRTGRGGVSKKRWPKKHDILLFYRKSKAYVHHPIQERIYYDKPFFGIETDDAGRYYADVYVRDIWDDIKPVINVSKERYGYPTQKPLELYERVIAVSSKEGDTVLDPFCGCATTPISCERLGRKWVGIDIWDDAYKAVIDRIDQFTHFVGHVAHTTELPMRTDKGDHAAPALRVKVSIPEPPGPKMTRQQMYDHLLTQQGWKCQGCDREFDDSRYLELDHNTPRSDGGVNHISNRVLLCGPCNNLKSNTYTLSGLRRENKKRGYMVTT